MSGVQRNGGTVSFRRGLGRLGSANRESRLKSGPKGFNKPKNGAEAHRSVRTGGGRGGSGATRRRNHPQVGARARVRSGARSRSTARPGRWEGAKSSLGECKLPQRLVERHKRLRRERRWCLGPEVLGLNTGSGATRRRNHPQVGARARVRSGARSRSTARPGRWEGAPHSRGPTPRLSQTPERNVGL
jgi:hypothetical protein